MPLLAIMAQRVVRMCYVKISRLRLDLFRPCGCFEGARGVLARFGPATSPALLPRPACCKHRVVRRDTPGGGGHSNQRTELLIWCLAGHGKDHMHFLSADQHL
jgi:hypothetical protein